MRSLVGTPIAGGSHRAARALQALLGQSRGLILLAGAVAISLPIECQETIKLLLVGDGGAEGSQLKAVADAATRRYVYGDTTSLDGVIYVGDNFYQTGLRVGKDGQPDQEQVDAILGPWRKLHAVLGKTKVHAVPGNHDYYKRKFPWLSGFQTKGVEASKTKLDQWTFHAYEPD